SQVLGYGFCIIVAVRIHSATITTVHFNGVKLHVDSSQPSVFALRGSNATLSCQYWYEPELSSPRRVRVKWSWLPMVGGHETDVLVAIGPRIHSFGDFRYSSYS
uniref:Immunoglobulin V-set domain-containing protein n=1 Tax=Hucho hucho TaxID=62062 RepID=A0A4W5PG37_9TELE